MLEPEYINQPKSSKSNLLSSLILLTSAIGCLFTSQVLSYDGVCRTVDDVTDLPPLHWCEVTNSKLDIFEKKPNEYTDWDGTSSASYNSYQRNLGFRSITNTWSGATFDDRRDRLIVWGGGHNGYGGNEIFAFDLRSLSWSRLTDPTVFPKRSPAMKNSDGTPISRHTYDGLAYISHRDELFAMGGAPDSASGGCGIDGTWVFSFSTQKWTDMRPTGNVPTTRCEDNAIYDPINRQVLYYNRDIRAYNREGNDFTIKSNEGSGNRKSHAIDPVRKLLIQVGSNDDGAVTRVANLNNLAAGFTRLNTSGATKLENHNNPGLTYDATSDRIVGWYGGSIVYSLNPATNVWTAHTPESTNRASPFNVTTQGGVYGRFRYSSALNVFVVVNETDESVFLYRLSEGTGLPQDKSPPSPPPFFGVD